MHALGRAFSSAIVVVIASAGAHAAPPCKAQGLVDAGRALVKAKGQDGAPEAAAKYRTALAKDPSCDVARWELGWAEQLQGKLDAAVAAWKDLEARTPTYPELAARLPVLLQRQREQQSLAALPPLGELGPRPEAPEGSTFTLRAVGDINMGFAWPVEMVSLPPNDAQDFFADVKDLLSSADLTFGNLETVLKDDGASQKCGGRSKTCYAFRVPTRYAQVVKDAGFDVISMANNHSGDYGEEGRQSTRRALDAAGLPYTGMIGDLASLEVRGIKVGVVAFASYAGLYDLTDIPLAQRVVAELKQRHDVVVVSFHGGAEGAAAVHVKHGTETFYGENRGNLPAFAHAVIDAGADLVLGHGPHRLRAMELYKGRLVAYSLGNFSSWGGFSLVGPLGISTILSVTLAKNGALVDAELHPTLLEKPGKPRPDPERQAIGIVRQLSKEDFEAELFDAGGRLSRPTATPTSLY